LKKDKTYDLIIIGGGQSALACAYYLRRTKLDYLVLDNQKKCGGAWLHGWDSLTLFSPSEHSSLPGWLMPKSKNEFPTKEEVTSYVCQYEKRYKIPVHRTVRVTAVTKDRNQFTINTNKGAFHSKAVISATGTWGRPFIPDVPGKNLYSGQQIHSAFYKNADELKNKKVLIVGEGNSGAQVLAEISKVSETVWTTQKEPQFLPDDVDGRVLFDQATAKYYADKKGEKLDTSRFNLGTIVMVPAVKDAKKRDIFHSKGRLEKFFEKGVIWENGDKEPFDAVIWCTGFGFATEHLKGIVSMDARGKIATEGTKAAETTGLWLVGYGGWTGFASATLIGVGRSAKQTVKEVTEYLNK
jgi:cation diffusion facilitator CzcD-associated flavoprotein CzcO